MKKIMLLALAVASAAAFMVPATASATFESLHMNPTPAKMDIVGSAGATLRSSAGTITCGGFSGNATPEAGGTTGTMQLTFGPDCTGPLGSTCTSTNPVHTNGSITTTVLPYHLVTLKGKLRGLLVTPANGAFAHFKCVAGIFTLNVTVEGNGVLGTITAPACGAASTTATMSFKASGGTTTQEHRQVAGVTESTIWSLASGGNPASQEAHATVTATNAAGEPTSTKLECT